MNPTPRIAHAGKAVRQHAAAIVLVAIFILGLGAAATLAAAHAATEHPSPSAEMIR